MLTVATAPLHTALVGTAAFRAALGVSSSADDPYLDDLLRRTSSRVEGICRQVFPRAAYVETVAGYGAPSLLLARTPVVQVSQVLFNNSPVTDFIIEDAAAGILGRPAGWSWTAPTAWDLSPRILAGAEEKAYAVSYWAGYLVSDDELRGSVTLSVVASDQSLNDSAGRFPRLVAGDRVQIAGFVAAANTGTFTVVSRTASKLVLSGGTLVDEAAGPAVHLTFDSAPYGPKLPGAIEQAVIELAKVSRANRARAAGVAERRVGDLSLRYDTATTSADEAGLGSIGVPGEILGMLLPYVRAA